VRGVDRGREKGRGIRKASSARLLVGPPRVAGRSIDGCKKESGCPPA
jgi:hypothetical protein